MLLMRSLAAMLTASVSIGSGVWLHGYTQTNTALGPGTLASVISGSSPLASILGSGKHRKLTLASILRAKHGRLAKLRAALGLGRIHPSWASPAALLVVIAGVGSSVLMMLRGFMMRRRLRHVAQGAGAIPPDLMRILGQFGRGSDAP